MDSWASHVSVRNFWGVTEDQDYNPNCANQTSVEGQEAFLRQCWPNGSNRKFKGWGWFCAQRRPGHALGWLQKMYQDVKNIPDMLILVDDDTAVDIREAVRQMVQVMDRPFHGQSPYVGNPCMMGKYAGVGGSGTFFNRPAIEGLTRPIFCDKRQQDSMNLVCDKLNTNSLGADLFQQGDSVFDIFYKYSAIREFCMHSDAATAAMINWYSELSGGLIQFGHCHGSRGQPCPNSGAISCHYQSPEKMKLFTFARTSPMLSFMG